MSMLTVENPEIPAVMSFETGVHCSLASVVGTNYDRALQLRMAVKESQKRGRPLYACSECGVAVSLLMHHESRRFYFKHVQEDGRCTAVTRGQLTQEEINARKYNGAKESWRHIRMKELVVASAHADQRFSDILVEGRWSDKLTSDWRRPDVQATYREQPDDSGVRVAFEIQLSTTYLDVIAERRVFYQDKGALLFWIFSEFNEQGRRLTQDDVFYNNNQNAFLVSEDTAATSIARGEFNLECVWAEPISLDSVTQLQSKLVPFHRLTLDTTKQQAYYFDFYGAKDAIRRKELADTLPLRDTFEQAWIASVSGEADIGKVWGKFYRDFRSIGVPLPFYPKELHHILLNALYSAKHGRVIGWGYKMFIEVAHRIASAHPAYLHLFRQALRVYDRAEQLSREDKSGKWQARVAQYKRAMRDGDSSYAPDTKHQEVVAFLFPELFAE